MRPRSTPESAVLAGLGAISCWIISIPCQASLGSLDPLTEGGPAPTQRRTARYSGWLIPNYIKPGM